MRGVNYSWNRKSAIENSPPPTTALITGAGSGIGRQTALLLAQTGARVALASRRQDPLDETIRLAAQRAGVDGDCAAFPADVCDPEACTDLVGRTVERFGRIDILVHAAGYAVLGALESNTPDEWRRIIDTNLSAAIYMTAAAWPHFQRLGQGVIVNVSSLASIDPFPRFSMYAAAKAGLNMFTRCTAREGEAIGVRAVCIAPGAVETPMLRSLFDETAIPRSRTLSAADVAAVIRDCALARRPFSNGETIQVASP